jgi:hypothetical protein
LAASLCPAAEQAAPVAGKDGWVSMFDGKTLDGWKANEHPESWSVKNGAIVGDGVASHLFWMTRECENCEFRAEVKLNHSGNSGMYFRAAIGKGWPAGYEAQVENTSPDPQKTGSLYNAPERHYDPIPVPVKEQLVPDDTWWTQHIVAIGNRIIIKVNDKIVTDLVDEHNTFTSGHLAFQQHNPGSEVQFRNVMVKSLPAEEKAAWEEARKDMPDLPKQ